MIELYLTYFLNLVSLVSVNHGQLSLLTKFLYVFNFVCLFLLILGFCFLNFSLALKNIAQLYLINILYIFSFFNCILVFFVYQLAFIYYFFKGVDVLLDLTSLVFLPISLLNIVLLPFILYFRQNINLLILRVIFWLCYAFGYIIDCILNYFFVQTIRTYLYFIYFINVSFLLSWYPFYLVVSVLLLICVFILRSPYFFELIDNQSIFANIDYLKLNVSSFTNFDVPEDKLAMGLLANIMFIAVNKHNITPKRFISVSRPFLIGEVLPNSGKSSIFNAENFTRLMAAIKDNPQQARIVLRGFFSISILTIGAHIFNIQSKREASKHSVDVSKHSVDEAIQKVKEADSYLEASKNKLQIADIKYRSLEIKAQILKDKRAIIEASQHMQASKTNFGKLQESSNIKEDAIVQVVDITPDFSLDNLDDSSSNTILRSIFETGDNVDCLFLFLTHFQDYFLMMLSL